MNKNITLHDLLLFAFNETPLSDTVRVADAMESDPLVKADYGELLDTIQGIREVAIAPSDRSIQKILAFAATK